MANILEMATHRTKGTGIWDSGVLAQHTWDICDPLVFNIFGVIQWSDIFLRNYDLKNKTTPSTIIILFHQTYYRGSL